MEKQKSARWNLVAPKAASVLERLFHALISARPGSRIANKLRAEIEHHLMTNLKTGGLRCVERSIARLNASGRALRRERETGRRAAGYRAWRDSFDGDRRLLEVSVLNNRGLQMASVRYRAIVRRRLTKRQRDLLALHEAFYARYNEVANRAYASNHGIRLRSADRLILLIAEQEADVNNGGFRQYLDNKGRRRARLALGALHKVGAKKTEAMLASALSRKVSDARLERLADQFYRFPEDLAALVMTHIAATE